MPPFRLTRVALAVLLLAASALLASCAGAKASGGPKLATWPLSVPDTVRSVVSAKAGGTVHASAFGVDTDIVFPPGALAEDTEVEIVPLASAPLKDGKPNFADGVFVRRVGDGVGSTLDLTKPAELRFSAARQPSSGLTIGRWYLSRVAFEPVQSEVKTVGGTTIVTAHVTTLAGYGARDPSGSTK